MADEEVVEESGEDKKSGGKLGLILMVAGLLIAVGGGLAVYFLVIAPKFAVEDGTAEGPTEDGDSIPFRPVYYSFESSFTNLMRDGSGAASTLLYQVSFECSNQGTSDLVDAYKLRFIDMLGKLHDSRTRAEVDDILLFKQSVQSQALQKSNAILERIVTGLIENKEVKEKDRSAYRITAVLHEKCAVADPA